MGDSEIVWSASLKRLRTAEYQVGPTPPVGLCAHWPRDRFYITIQSYQNTQIKMRKMLKRAECLRLGSNDDF